MVRFRTNVYRYLRNVRKIKKIYCWKKMCVHCRSTLIAGWIHPDVRANACGDAAIALQHQVIMSACREKVTFTCMVKQNLFGRFCTAPYRNTLAKSPRAPMSSNGGWESPLGCHWTDQTSQPCFLLHLRSPSLHSYRRRRDSKRAPKTAGRAYRISITTV